MSRKKRGASWRRKEFHNKIKNKINKIINSGNKVDFSDKNIHDTMVKYDMQDYRIEVWGDVRVVSKFGSWIIKVDNEVVYLYHASQKNIKIGNDRSSYHIHNVFYDLDYCVRSIAEHDSFTGSG